MRAARKSKGCANKSKAVLTHSTPKLFPLASELERPLPNSLADRLVGGEGVEPFGLRLVVVSQEVKQTQRLSLRSQLRSPRPQQTSFVGDCIQRDSPKSFIDCIQCLENL